MSDSIHALATLINRNHPLIQQLEKDCTALRLRVQVLEDALMWLRDHPLDAGAVHDIAVTVLDANAPTCGNCKHPKHIANSERCQICLAESNAGNRAIGDCCASYEPIS